MDERTRIYYLGVASGLAIADETERAEATMRVVDPDMTKRWEDDPCNIDDFIYTEMDAAGIIDASIEEKIFDEVAKDDVSILSEDGTAIEGPKGGAQFLWTCPDCGAENNEEIEEGQRLEQVECAECDNTFTIAEVRD